MIPAEAVEAAAKAYRHEFPYDENEGYVVQLILEAAAPYMLATAWGEGFGAGWNDCLLDLENGGAKTTVNPHMLNTEGEK